MAQDSALVLALDGEVNASAEARAVDCCFAHVERYDRCDELDGTMRVVGDRTATGSIIIIDQNLLGVNLGPGLRPW